MTVEQQMTLKQWCREANKTYTSPTETGAVSVTVLRTDHGMTDDLYVRLWNLSDYTVTSGSLKAYLDCNLPKISERAIAVVWLSKIPEPTPRAAEHDERYNVLIRAIRDAEVFLKAMRPVREVWTEGDNPVGFGKLEGRWRLMCGNYDDPVPLTDAALTMRVPCAKNVVKLPEIIVASKEKFLTEVDATIDLLQNMLDRHTDGDIVTDGPYRRFT